jgi:hypothetical protein
MELVHYDTQLLRFVTMLMNVIWYDTITLQMALVCPTELPLMNSSNYEVCNRKANTSTYSYMFPLFLASQYDLNHVDTSEHQERASFHILSL